MLRLLVGAALITAVAGDAHCKCLFSGDKLLPSIYTNFPDKRPAACDLDQTNSSKADYCTHRPGMYKEAASIAFYGTSCAAWDQVPTTPWYSYCSPPTFNATIHTWDHPDFNWCQQPWCYVNETCSSAVASSVFRGSDVAFYSYLSCGSTSNCFTNIAWNSDYVWPVACPYDPTGSKTFKVYKSGKCACMFQGQVLGKGIYENYPESSPGQYKDEEAITIYGVTCAPWDNMAGTPWKSYCPGPSEADYCDPDYNWCQQQWCYVDKDCETAVPSSVFRGSDVAFYSYDTCQSTPNCFTGIAWEDPILKVKGCPFDTADNGWDVPQQCTMKDTWVHNWQEYFPGEDDHCECRFRADKLEREIYMNFPNKDPPECDVSVTNASSPMKCSKYPGMYGGEPAIAYYGTTCAAWDAVPGTPWFSYCPNKSVMDAMTPPRDYSHPDYNWCQQPWCYVEGKCKTAVASSVFRGSDVAFYSYFSCGANEKTSNCFTNIAWNATFKPSEHWPANCPYDPTNTQTYKIYKAGTCSCLFEGKGLSSDIYMGYPDKNPAGCTIGTNCSNYPGMYAGSGAISIYGSTCAAWDYVPDTPWKSYCPEWTDKCNPEFNWCIQPWCYVSSSCPTAVGTSVFSGSSTVAYYSYDTCMSTPNCYTGVAWKESFTAPAACPFDTQDNGWDTGFQCKAGWSRNSCNLKVGGMLRMDMTKASWYDLAAGTAFGMAADWAMKMQKGYLLDGTQLMPHNESTFEAFIADITTGTSPKVDIVLCPYTAESSRKCVQSVASGYKGIIIVWGSAEDISDVCANKHCIQMLTTAGQQMAGGLKAMIEGMYAGGVAAEQGGALPKVKVALITNDNGFSRQIASGLIPLLSEMQDKATPVATVDLKVYLQDLTDEDKTNIAAAMDNKPDIVIVLGDNGDVEPTIIQIGMHKHRPSIVIATNALGEKATENFGDHAKYQKCVITPTQWGMLANKDSLLGWDSKAFQTAMMKAMTEMGLPGMMDGHAAAAGGAAVALMNGIDKMADSINKTFYKGCPAMARETVAANIKGLDITSFYGKLKFGATGAIMKGMAFQQSVEGKFILSDEAMVEPDGPMISEDCWGPHPTDPPTSGPTSGATPAPGTGSSGTAGTDTTALPVDNTSTAADTKETTMDATFAMIGKVDEMDNDALETFQSKAEKEFATATGVDKSKVQAVATPVVKSTVTLKEDVTVAQFKTITAATVGTTEDKVTVTENTAAGRRLGDARRLAKTYDVAVEVASTAAAKAAAANLKDTDKMVKKAADAGITIEPPTVSEPKVEVAVKYTVQGAAAQPDATAVTALGSALGAAATISNVQIVEKSTTTVGATTGFAWRQSTVTAPLVLMAVAAVMA